MAISEHLPGIVVDIRVDGTSLKEYQDSTVKEDQRTTTRYVEAKSGQNFIIHFRCLPEFQFAGDCITFRVCMDGEWMDISLLPKTKRSATSRGVELPGGMVRKYYFNDLETGKNH
jgi:hypothetical protein